jgi:hypothetical protein
MAHEATAADPVPAFRAMFDRLSEPWAPAVEELLQSRNQPGQGYAVSRVGGEESQRWRTRLAPDDIAVATGVLDSFSGAAAGPAALWSSSPAVV